MHIVIRGSFHTRADVLALIGRAAWGIDRPGPTNLDGLADLIKETSLRSITIQGIWAVDEKTASAINRICGDLGVSLRLPAGTDPVP